VTAQAQPWARDILHVWFHRLGSEDWFAPTDAIDAMLEDRFGEELERQAKRAPGEFLADPQIALAATILFDQIPRNIHRDTAQAFAHDRQARAITHGVIERGWLEDYTEDQRQFALMPLMHSEQIHDQDLSVELFARYAPGALEFARSHREMIARFGRFPHRNDILGRESSEAEKEAIADGFSW
jgi:uncharacterized protein (DUF924 family)